MEKKILLNLFENQAHFGHYRKHRTPQLNSNIYTTKFGVDFINLDLSVKQIELAKDFLSRTRDKNILIVSARSYLISKNSENNIYQISKWKPGYISNFDYGKLDELPNIVIVDKAAYQENLIKEAKKIATIIGICDTNTPNHILRSIEYPIVMNDDNGGAVEILLNYLM